MRPTMLAGGLGMMRRQFLALGLMSLGGCASLFKREEEESSLEELLADTTSNNSNVRLVGDVANDWGMTWLKLESVALVNGLAGTGSNPPAGPQRQSLVDEMQTHHISNPNELLASPATSLVLTRAYLPPGVHKDDRFDVEVRIPSRSETTRLVIGHLSL